MKRIILMLLKNIWYLPYAWIRLCWYAAHTDDYPEEKIYAFLQDVDHHANWGGNVKIEAYGVENIPQENGFMFFPNHQGMYDVLAMLESCPVPFSVVAKKEVGNIPGLKQVFRCMRAFLIDREDIRQSMRVIQDVAKEVSAGRNYVIFPEGTRSRQGNQVQEFKGGSFKSATKCKCPIVPVALIDSYKAFDTGSIKQVTVQVHYLSPIRYEEYQGMKTVEIAEEVKKRIEQTIAEYTTK